MVEKLGEEATKQAARSLVRYGFTDAVEQVTAASAATSSVVVTGSVRMFVSLPPQVRGWHAGHRKGHFATGTVTIRDAKTGSVLASGEATCDWGDAWWVQGPRNWRNAPLDKVLAHFARKTTERAIKAAARRDTGVAGNNI